MQTRTTIPFYYIVGWSNEQKYYIGSRYANGCDPSDLGTKYFTSSKVVKEKWKEQPPDIVQVLLTFETKEQAREWEATALHNFGVPNNPMFLNKSAGTKGFRAPEVAWNKGLKTGYVTSGFNGRTHTEETKKHLSEKMKSRVLTEEHKQALYNATQDPVVKRKKAEASKKRWADPEYKKRMSDKRKGRVNSATTREKLSAANKGKLVSSETRAKLSAANKGKPRINKRKLIQTPIGEFLGRKEACDNLKITDSQLDTLMKRQPHLYYYGKKER